MNYSHPSEIMDEMAKVTPIYRGVNYNRLETDGLRWPVWDDSHPGTPILHTQQFSRGLGLFQIVEHRPPAEEPDLEYPFILTTGRVHFHWHTGTMTRRSSTLTSQLNEAYVEINNLDAIRLNIFDEQVVKVGSRRGEITLKAHVTEKIKQGVLFIPFHFKEAPANILTNNALDAEAKIPEYKVCAVKIRPIN